ncbi:FkbM family methyltransferase [Neobacillus cucumis]|uniref:FkbM family methyltransferase n=1 Tax=Neobacillus cucumis TaxID=1740721 RepID=UPI0018DF606F|nr:FkbM family methyltransferase [Neobacillus cucumis]MBI0577793.1 FkbM family methyltransferase [Neobacillus cucumis]
MRGTYIGEGKMLIHTAFNGKLIVPANDLGIGPDLIIHGAYDIGLTKYFMSTVRPGDVVVDIGANVGLFSILAGYLVGDSGKVYCFEANKSIFQFLQDNISMNWLRKTVHPFNKAIYSSQDILTFTIDAGNHTLSTLYEVDQWNKNGYHDSLIQVQVESEPLDNYFNQIDHIRLLKMDIEGAEYDAFLGMEKFLTHGKIENISFEWNIPMLKERTEPLLELLKFYSNQGYTLFLMNGEGNLTPITIENLGKTPHVPNIVMKK